MVTIATETCSQPVVTMVTIATETCSQPVVIVSWGNFGHLRALFLFWPSNSFGMGFGCLRS